MTKPSGIKEGTPKRPARSARPPQGGVADVEAALIEAAKLGDRRALSILLAAARPRALAVALRVTRNPDDAEDAVQDAFIKVLRAIVRFEERAAFSTWLHRIVVNACLDRLRRTDGRGEKAGGAPIDGEGEEMHSTAEGIDEETPEQVVGRRETGVVVRRAMDALSPAHRDVLVLREFEDRSYAEIAEASRCPIGTIMSRLHHARRRLADELAAVGAEPLLEAA